MASQKIWILGILLSFIGWLGTIITCALPMWIVFIGDMDTVYWNGLWKACELRTSTQEKRCIYYQLEHYFLAQEMLVGRVMVILSLIVGVFGIPLGVVGGKLTNCIENEASKAKACIVSGVIFIIAALLILIPVSWSAHVIISGSYEKYLIGLTRLELGAALYIGWASAVLLFVGGGLLCSNFLLSLNRPFTPANIGLARAV
ncbi:claudin-4-like [Fundulus heteroclitus]|uniref:claudin-4-like n=1 Tax=Fundulus heteroclitus TaxID=8078 RepID=UPI00165BF94D|nr:claudin-4-like [Fundulus heteroclitus]